MKIEDKGFILSAQKFGENSLIIKILSQENGIIHGIFRASSKNKNHILQGNQICFTWNARLQEHLGNISISVEKSYGTICYNNYQKILSINSLCSLILELFPEREKIENIHKLMQEYLSYIESESIFENWLEKYILLKLELLKNSGFGFDFNRCSETGVAEVFYISPKTGACVCKEIGDPYKEKLFIIPKIFLENSFEKTKEDIIQAIEIIRYFLAKHIFSEKNKNLPFAFEEFYSILKNQKKNLSFN
ncbi:MAG: DNA repair protein RecO [Rickettsiales bacterium]|nr:DNA repair protein RecO [Rickettsiales bacterium]